MLLSLKQWDSLPVTSSRNDGTEKVFSKLQITTMQVPVEKYSRHSRNHLKNEKCECEVYPSQEIPR